MFFVHIFVDVGTENKAAHVPRYHDKSTHKHGLNHDQGRLNYDKGGGSKKSGLRPCINLQMPPYVPPS